MVTRSSVAERIRLMRIGDLVIRIFKVVLSVETHGKLSKQLGLSCLIL